MARGNIAKKNVESKIMSAFGADYILTEGSKIYVWADDGGERVQIALAMTCPKAAVGTTNVNANKSGELDFENMTESKSTEQANASGFSAAEQETINDLIRKLGL